EPLATLTPSAAALSMTLLAPLLYLPRPPGGITWTEIYLAVYWLPLVVLATEIAWRRYGERRI
ncbi:MAG: hypothetical protein AB7L18_11650, partial [Hyphomicrobiaceae bacterium]